MEQRIVAEGLATMTGLMDHMDEETHTLKVRVVMHRAAPTEEKAPCNCAHGCTGIGRVF